MMSTGRLACLQGKEAISQAQCRPLAYWAISIGGSQISYCKDKFILLHIVELLHNLYLCHFVYGHSKQAWGWGYGQKDDWHPEEGPQCLSDDLEYALQQTFNEGISMGISSHYLFTKVHSHIDQSDLIFLPALFFVANPLAIAHNLAYFGLAPFSLARTTRYFVAYQGKYIFFTIVFYCHPSESLQHLIEDNIMRV